MNRCFQLCSTCVIIGYTKGGFSENDHMTLFDTFDSSAMLEYERFAVLNANSNVQQTG